MGWGINFTADIYLSRQNYNENIYEVQEEIDRLEEVNRGYKEQMLMMVMGGASSVSTKDVEGNECDPVGVLHAKFNEILGYYEENLSKIIDLSYYRKHLEEKQSDKGDGSNEPVKDNELLQTRLIDFAFPGMNRNVLWFNDIRTIGDLVNRSPSELLALRNFGRKSLSQVRESLADHGLHLRGDYPWFKEEMEWRNKHRNS